MEGYDCKRTWVYKEREDRLIAANIFIYVEDRRPIGPTEDICWEASRNWI